MHPMNLRTFLAY